MSDSSNSPSPEQFARLEEAARAVAALAYAPYSKFCVGAALLLTDGTVVTGCNVENVSYGLTICAERSALVSAVSQCGPGIRVATIAVTNLNKAASPPCGACRQVLQEFVTGSAWISFPSDKGIERRPFADLLPFSFRMWAE